MTWVLQVGGCIGKSLSAVANKAKRPPKASGTKRGEELSERPPRGTDIIDVSLVWLEIL